MVGAPVQTLLIKQPTEFLGEVLSLQNTTPAPLVVHS